MTNEIQPRAFISYSRSNKDFASQFAKRLRTAGYSIWFDLFDIPTGSRWDDVVEKALQESSVFVVILTPASIASENVKDEIGYAIDHGKRILPILLEPCNVPLRLRRFQYVDFTNKNFEDGLKSAMELMSDLAGAPKTVTPEPVIEQAKHKPVENQGAAIHKKDVVLAATSKKQPIPMKTIGIAVGLLVALVVIILGVMSTFNGDTGTIVAQQVTPVVAESSYTISCIVDDPNGSSIADNDVRLLLIPQGETVTVTVTDCYWYYSRGAITPLGEGVEIATSESVTFTVSGGAYLSTYIPGQYTFEWTFANAPVSTPTP